MARLPGRSIPDESALRKNYISYGNTLKRIRAKVHGNKIFIPIDESYDLELMSSWGR